MKEIKQDHLLLSRSSNAELSLDYTSKGKVSASLHETHIQVIDKQGCPALSLDCLVVFASQNRAAFVILPLLLLLFWRLENNLDGSIKDQLHILQVNSIQNN